MKNHRKFSLSLASGLVALSLVAGAALADEFFGVLTKVDVEGKTVTVVDKESDKDVLVRVNDKSEFVGRKGAVKVDLEKLATKVEKAKEKGRKGIVVKVVHEKAVASKIYAEAQNKDVPKDKN